MRVNAEIKFECSHCGQRMSVELAAAGMNISCPSCHAAMQVPYESVDFHDDAPVVPDPPVDHELIALREQLVEATMSRGRLERDLAGAQVELETFEKHVRALDEQREALVQALEEARASSQQFSGELESGKREVDRLRSRCGSLETEKEMAARTAAEQQAALENSQAMVVELEASITELKSQLKKAKKEATNARKDVEASADAKKARKVREDLAASEEAQAKMREELANLHEAHVALEKREVALQEEKDGWRERCLDAERKVQALSESQLQKDNTVLRSILERQKVELEQRFRELKRLRRAQLGLRLAYALFGLGLVSLVLIVVPRLKDISSWFID